MRIGKPPVWVKKFEWNIHVNNSTMFSLDSEAYTRGSFKMIIHVLLPYAAGVYVHERVHNAVMCFI